MVSAFSSSSLTTVYATQNQGTAKNALSASFSGEAGTVNVSGGDHTHQLPYRYITFYDGNSENRKEGLSSGLRGDYTDSSGNLSMSGTFTPRGTVSLSSSDTETRPKNFTIKVWLRPA